MAADELNNMSARFYSSVRFKCVDILTINQVPAPILCAFEMRADGNLAKLLTADRAKKKICDRLDAGDSNLYTDPNL
jgi:hypothetical protein